MKPFSDYPDTARLTPENPGLNLQDGYRREADHRIANSLQIAVASLRLEARGVADPAAKAALDRATFRLHGIARLHRRLSAGPMAAEVDVQDYLEGLRRDLAEALGIDYHVEGEHVMIDSGLANKLGLILNEIALNAVKHAYNGKKPGELRVRARHVDGKLWLSVADDGPGLPDGFEAGKGSTGMAILQAIVSDLDGRMRAISDGGALFEIVIPLAGRSVG